MLEWGADELGKSRMLCCPLKIKTVRYCASVLQKTKLRERKKQQLALQCSLVLSVRQPECAAFRLGMPPRSAKNAQSRPEDANGTGREAAREA